MQKNLDEFIKNRTSTEKKLNEIYLNKKQNMINHNYTNEDEWHKMTDTSMIKHHDHLYSYVEHPPSLNVYYYGIIQNLNRLLSLINEENEINLIKEDKALMLNKLKQREINLSNDLKNYNGIEEKLNYTTDYLNSFDKDHGVFIFVLAELFKLY